jgi:peptidyl-prolyl cis-trans isomerase A (cyclophilin A)
MTRRRTTLTLLGTAALLGLSALLLAGQGAGAAEEKPVVVLDTSLGKITVELDPEKAPITVANFLKYVDSGFYDNTIFHRVMPDFMIQGGGMDDKLEEKPTRAPIKNESGNGLSNTRGTIAMARRPDPNSATAQFFINLFDSNKRLDNYAGGYAVFGKVTSGMDVVDAIAKVQTGTKIQPSTNQAMDDVPLKPVYIKSAKRKTKS